MEFDDILSGSFFDVREEDDESRAANVSNVERRIVKKPNICKQCEMNNDPRKVPVHPHCDCDVVTDSIDTGVADPQSRFLGLLRNGIDSIEIEGDFPADSALALESETVSIMDIDDVRFSDVARWLEAIQPYLDKLDTATSYLSFVLDEDNQDAIDQVSETVSALTEDSETIAEAIKDRKLWFSIAKAVAL